MNWQISVIFSIFYQASVFGKIRESGANQVGLEESHAIENGQGISSGHYILSPDNECSFTMHRNGNAVLSRYGSIKFETGTRVPANSDPFPKAVYENGALKVINRTSVIYKLQMIKAKDAIGTRLSIDNFCDLMIQDQNDNCLWSNDDTNQVKTGFYIINGNVIWSPNKKCYFRMQADGNAVLKGRGTVYFETGTKQQRGTKNENDYPRVHYDDGWLRVDNNTHDDVYKWQMITETKAIDTTLRVTNKCGFEIRDKDDNVVWRSEKDEHGKVKEKSPPEESYPIENGQGIENANYILSPDNECRFQMQRDGNAVLKRGNTIYFETGSQQQSSLGNDKTYPMVIYHQGALEVITKPHILYKWQMIEKISIDLSITKLQINNNCTMEISDDSDQVLWSSDKLRPGQHLSADKKMVSSNGKYVCHMQNDCTFAIYPMGGTASQGRVFGKWQNDKWRSCQLKLDSSSDLYIYDKMVKTIRTGISFSSDDDTSFECPEDSKFQSWETY